MGEKQKETINNAKEGALVFHVALEITTDNGTEDITDDIIIYLRYSGYSKE